jgi:hypothetical protein
MCMYIYVCVCVYIVYVLCIYMYMSVYVCMCIYMYAYICGCVCIYMCVYMVCMYAYICVYVCICVYMMSTHASILVDNVGPPSADVVEHQQVSFKWITQGLSNSGRKRSKIFLSSNSAITIQEVSCVPNTPNTLIRCICALVWRRDSKIQVIWMIISSKYNLK